MRRTTAVIMMVLIGLAMALFSGQGQESLKVFISVDMEGVAGVVNWEDVSRNGKDYALFRRLMTEETNAAIEGALEAGATEILVRDSHGSARNILPNLLRSEAMLIRDWSGGQLGMMEGIDETFDAVIFVGYHARAGTPDAPLSHTMTGRLADVVLNGKKIPEAGLNAFIAGNFDVPVVMVAGGAAICRQAKELFGVVEMAPVKYGIGTAVKTLHPEKAQALIKAKTITALKRLGDFKPYKPAPPYTMDLTFTEKAFTEGKIPEKAFRMPGAELTGDRTVSFTSEDWLEILKFFNGMI